MAKIKSTYYRLAQAGKPEHLGKLTFTADETASRLADYQAIAGEAQALNERIPDSLRDAYFQLILYPVQSACAMNEKTLYARQGAESAQKAQTAFECIQTLTRKYNEETAGGKWSGMMSWHPRDQAVFKMPEIATAQGSGTSEPNLAAVLAADAFAGKRDVSGVSLSVIEGLGVGGKGLTLMPFDGTSRTAENAPYVEYQTELAAGSRRIVVKCLPTHRIYEGLGLRYAISVNGDKPQIVDVDTPTEARAWQTNVLRGYGTGETTHEVNSGGPATIRVYLLDPGLVINRLEIF
jgi:hypothetical protein